MKFVLRVFLVVLLVGPLAVAAPKHPGKKVNPQPPETPAQQPPPAPPSDTTDTKPADDKTIYPLLPDVGAIFGGKILFSADAFPILATSTVEAMQSSLASARPTICKECRGTGVTIKKQTTYRGGPLQTPTTTETPGTCAACKGYGSAYPEKFSDRMLTLVDNLAHLKRNDRFAAVRTAAEDRLKDLLTETRPWKGPKGSAAPPPHEAPARPLVEPLWNSVRAQHPAGQPVVVIGNTDEVLEKEGWFYLKMSVPTDPHRPNLPDAIIIGGSNKNNIVPLGNVAVGGLLVGHAQFGKKKVAVPVILAVAAKGN